MTKRSLLSRRLFLGAAPAVIIGVNLSSKTRAEKIPTKDDPRLKPYIIGNPEAKVLVQEWFSLTCTHCAHFAMEEFPKIREQFINTGKIRYQFHDFPLDQVSLIASMVARSLPEQRYEAFINSLFSRQMQWAFSGGNPLDHLRQEAALAGISSSHFDNILHDKAFMQALGEQARQEGDTYHIEGTPYFHFNDVPYKADPETIEKFAELVSKASQVPAPQHHEPT